MPPKRVNKPVRNLTKGGKPPSTGQSGSVGPTKPKAGPWWVFTHKSSAFAVAAHELSTELTRRYGPGVSISNFEKMIVEYPTLQAHQQKLIFLDGVILDLYQSYVAARENRDAERESFRNTKDVEAVGTALEQVRGLMVNDQSERSEREEQKLPPTAGPSGRRNK